MWNRIKALMPGSDQTDQEPQRSTRTNEELIPRAAVMSIGETDICQQN